MMSKLSLALVALMGVSVSAQALSIEHVEPRKMEEVDYVRMGEYFGKEHSNPTRLELYTSQKPANGMAWIVETDTDIEDIAAGTKLRLEVLLKGERKAKVYDFEIPENGVDSKVIYLAVDVEDAGGDDSKAAFPRILAWKVSFFDGEALLSEAPSALWEY